MTDDKKEKEIEMLEKLGSKLTEEEKFWLEELIVNEAQYRELYNITRRDGFLDKIMKWIGPLMILMLIPLMFISFYFLLGKPDYNRADFMYECVIQDEMTQDSCEEILEGNYEVKENV